jgi:hypothetical protein
MIQTMGFGGMFSKRHHLAVDKFVRLHWLSQCMQNYTKLLGGLEALGE